MELILNSYGLTLKRELGMFLIETNEGKQTIPPEKVKSILISKGARISSDAILLAIENEVDVVFVDASGNPKGRVWSIAYGSIATIRKNQLAFIYSSKSVDWIKKLLIEKLNNQSALLLMFETKDKVQERFIQKALNTIEDHKNKIKQIEGEFVSDISPSLRGWEGGASRRYFEAINIFLPEGWRFETRSQNPATDKFNALLNYSYGMLYGKIESALIRAGLDPYTGVFHRDQYNRPVLVYDVIEKFRIWADFVCVQLAVQDVFSEECFTISSTGAVMLDGLGKRILIQGMNDYLYEIIELKGIERSRATHLDLYALKLAQMFMKA